MWVSGVLSEQDLRDSRIHPQLLTPGDSLGAVNSRKTRARSSSAAGDPVGQVINCLRENKWAASTSNAEGGTYQRGQAP